MKTVNHIKLNYQLIRLIAPAILLCSLADVGLAAGLGFPGDGGAPTNTPLDSWSFRDTVTWSNDFGYAPVSFTNLNYSYLGNGRSLVVDTNIPAWLQYNVWENDGTTNLTVDSGTILFWFAPNWNSVCDTNGGTGPGEYGRLLETGSYTDDSSYGWWSIFVDDTGNNIYFAAQTNDLSSSMTVYLSAPIDWTTNYFHFLALTYSPTSSALYVDGVLVTNGAGVTVYPGPEVLTNGFCIGSDNTGTNQAHGFFNTVATYNYPLNSNDVQTIFNWEYTSYIISPWNTAMMNIVSAPSNPSGSQSYYDAITGQGGLQLVGSVTAINSTNIWITNVTTSVTSGGMSMTFTIQGGSDNVPYYVFANSVLSFGSTGIPWAWMGQGYHGNTYTLTNLPNTACFLILGFPQDTDLDGLTDAYENLVSKSNPNVYNTSGDGLSDAWDVLLGLSPLVNQFAQPSTRSNYSYDSADWLEGISGIRTGSVSLDNEGNVLSVSQ